jgi:hypothetical protein
MAGATTENNMADGINLTQLGNLPPELYEQQQALNRQQQMAAMLMQQGQQAPQGQIISGRYVAPSFTQNLANLAQIYAGTSLQKEGDTKTAGMVAMFSLLPGVGSIIPKIPGIGQLGAKGMAALAPKLTKGGTQLTKLESEVIQGISDNLSLVQQELNTYVKRVATEAGKKVADPTKAQVLANIAKQGVVGITKAATPYVAAGAAYSKGYDAVQSNTPKVKTEKEGLDWNFVKTAFGSSGNEQDNLMLNKAWDNGWRPGTLVPKEFRTKQYQIELDKETEGINQLSTLIASVK